MHVDAHVPVVVAVRLSGMKSHPDPDRFVERPCVRLETMLHRQRRSDRVGGGGEDHEEAVAFGAHLAATPTGDLCSHDRALH
jgi:hypothetical protein